MSLPCPWCGGSGWMQDHDPAAVAKLPTSRAAYIAILADVEVFAVRVIQEAIAQALPDVWRRRAAQFDWIVDGGPGGKTIPASDPIARRARRDAAWCRIHAHLLAGGDALDDAIAADRELTMETL